MKGALAALIISFFLALPARGQLRYGGVQQGQLAFASRETNYGFSMVHGARAKRYLLGIGVDALFKNNRFYGTAQPYNTSAVFASARKYGWRRDRFFIKADAGLNFVAQKVLVLSPVPAKIRPKAGGYAAAGIGFRAHIGKEMYYTFDVSYVYRHTSYEYRYQYFTDRVSVEKTDIRRFMIVVAMGIEVF